MQYKCKSIHNTNTITFDPVNGFGHSKGHFGEVFHGQSSHEIKSAVTYKSADIKIIITVSFDPVDGFGHSKSHFGVVF